VKGGGLCPRISAFSRLLVSLGVLCVFVVKFGLLLPFAVADFADDPEYGMVRLIFQGADKVGE
jgi:hypothetical protein